MRCFGCEGLIVRYIEKKFLPEFLPAKNDAFLHQKCNNSYHNISITP